MYIYIYIYICICVCVEIYKASSYFTAFAFQSEVQSAELEKKLRAATEEAVAAGFGEFVVETEASE